MSTNLFPIVKEKRGVKTGCMLPPFLGVRVILVEHPKQSSLRCVATFNVEDKIVAFAERQKVPKYRSMSEFFASVQTHMCAILIEDLPELDPSHTNTHKHTPLETAIVIESP